MTNPLLVLGGVLAIALLYVVVPVVADVFTRFRRSRPVRCPDTGARAQVGIDTRRAALTAAFGPPRLRVRDCSLWPVQAGCPQRCLSQLLGGTPDAASTATARPG